jgi:hypothetical protein
MAFVTVNWLSIILAAVAAWLFGGIYYSATSKFWLAAQGKTMEQCQAEQAAKSWFSSPRSSSPGRCTASSCT